MWSKFSKICLQNSEFLLKFDVRMSLPSVNRMSEDYVYSRVFRPNLFLCPRDVKLKHSLRRSVTTLVSRSGSLLHCGSSWCGPSFQKFVYRIPNSY